LEWSIVCGESEKDAAIRELQEEAALIVKDRKKVYHIWGCFYVTQYKNCRKGPRTGHWKEILPFRKKIPDSVRGPVKGNHHRWLTAKVVKRFQKEFLGGNAESAIQATRFKFP